MDLRITIEGSFKKLICNSSYDKVTVMDICEDAHISRKTFYEYFHGKEDVLKSYLVRNTVNSLRFLHDTLSYLSPEELLKTQCIHLYYSIEKDKRFYSRLIGDGLGDSTGVLVRAITDVIQSYNQEVFHRIMEQLGEGWKVDYASYFFASSQAMLVKKWIQDGMNVPPDELGDLYINLTSHFWLNFINKPPEAPFNNEF